MRTIDRARPHWGALAAAVAIGGLLPAVVPVVARADTPLPPNCSTTSYPGFGSAANLTLNGRATVVTTTDGQVLRVTNSQYAGGAGSAFTTAKVALHDAGSFSTAFSFRVSSMLNDGADGLVFTVQNVANNVGAAGGAMGYGGIDHSVGVEFDDWDNHIDGINDPDGNHVGIDLNGSMNSVAVQPLSPIVIDDASTIKHAWVDYNGTTDLLEVRVATSTTRPASAIVSTTVDLPALLGSVGSPAEDAFVGFSAGTGSAAANFDVVDWSYNNCYQPVGVDTSPVVDAGGPYAGHKASPVSLAGSVTDDQAGPTALWSWAGGPSGATCTFGDATQAATTVTCDRSGTYTLTLTGTDSIGQTGTDTATLTVTNQAPVAGALDLVASSACTVDATLHFTDADPADTHTVSFDWGDGSSAAGAVTESAGSGTGTGSHTFAHAGTYAVAGTVSDGAATATASAAYATKNAAGAFLPPINAAGTRSVFRLGSTIPVKIVVTDCDGAVVPTLTPVVSVTKIDTSAPPPNESPVDAVPTNGRAMVWSTDHYQFNLSTKRSQFGGGADLTAGTYRITVSDPTLVTSASVLVDLG